MDLKWITINDKLKHGITLINSLPTKKFALLIENFATITSENQQTLGKTLQLDTENLQLLLQTIVHIFKQLNKVILKPTILEKQFNENLQIDADKTELFLKVWLQQMNRDFGDLMDRKRLDDLTWNLNVQTASKFNNKEIQPNVRLNLQLSNCRDSEVLSEVLDLDEEELLSIYNTIEAMQNKLDVLS